MMMDIASWLREVRMSTNTSDWNAAFVNNRLDEAANEIERLREALEKIGDGDECIRLLVYPTRCKRAYEARAALNEGE